MSQHTESESFFPKGAIASLVAMVAFYAVLWFTLFSLMAERG